MLPKIKIQDIFRVSGIKRWGIVDTPKEQDVAQHSFNVAHIARELVKRMVEIVDITPEAEPFIMSLVLQWALMHDLSEVFTGDVPTPFKNSLNREETAWESETVLGFKDRIPKGVKYEVLMIVKVADILEARKFLTPHTNIQQYHVLQELEKRFEEAISVTVSRNFENVARQLATDILSGNETFI